MLVVNVYSPPKLLTFSQLGTPGKESLPLSASEVDGVEQIISSAGWLKEGIIRLGQMQLGIMLRVLWIHALEFILPVTESSLQHQAWKADLSHIKVIWRSKRLSTGQFAFLSACHTAAGLNDLPGEAMRLATALHSICWLSQCCCHDVER